MARRRAVDDELGQANRLQCNISALAISPDPALQRVAARNEAVIDAPVEPDALPGRHGLRQRARVLEDDDPVGVADVDDEDGVLEPARGLEDHVERDWLTLL